MPALAIAPTAAAHRPIGTISPSPVRIWYARQMYVLACDPLQDPGPGRAGQGGRGRRVLHGLGPGTSNDGVRGGASTAGRGRW